MLPVKAAGGLAFERPVSEFIPAACMWDKNTVLTKNGELLQTIKIVGFTHESVGSENVDLRALIREAITGCIPDDKFAVWIHTIRRVCDLDPGGAFEEPFAKRLNASWRKNNKWDTQYVNEVYITVLREGKRASVSDLGAFLQSLYFGIYYKTHQTYLEAQIAPLYEVTEAILKTLTPFGAKRLCLNKLDEVYYSDYLRFFGKLINLSDERMPADNADMGQQLASHKSAFGYNSFETIGPTGKHFGSMFLVKEYQELSLDSLDELLQLPMQMIITQTLDFVNSKKALEDFEDQYALLKFSNAEKLIEMSGLENIIQSDNKSKTDFAESQITLTVIDDDLRRLDKHIDHINEVFADLGMVAPRLDVDLEDAYWAQLPGNFSFIKHKKNISARSAGGLSSLFNFPAGKRYDSYWERAVTMFHTAKGTPYFFNFHMEDNGHTAVVGVLDAGKTVLVNFVLSESMKFSPRVYILDHAKESEIFVRALNGRYIDITPDGAPPADYDSEFPADGLLYDPFAVAGEHEEEALADFLTALLSYDPEEFGKAEKKRAYRASFDTSEEEEDIAKPVADIDTAAVKEAVRAVMRLPQEERSLVAAAALFKDRKNYYLNLKPYLPEGEYAHLFAARKARKGRSRVTAFDMTKVKDIAVPALGVTALLLFDIERRLQGEKTVIVIDEAWDLVNKTYFATRLKPWLKRMRKKNAVVIFATDNFNNMAKSPISAEIAAEFATQIFLPNPRAEEYSKSYQGIWELSDIEFEMLKEMDKKKREFLLKNVDEAVICRLNLTGMPETEILSGSQEKSDALQEIMGNTGEDPVNWVDTFCQRFTSKTQRLEDM